jgi:UDP-N-acetylglucosamine diphosphorylase/glucosamine-1-phosphate N-acetyltransferase
MQLCIFEDIYYSDFEPLVFNRPVYDLLCGTFTLKEKIVRHMGFEKYSLHCREYLLPVMKRDNIGVEVNNFPNDDCLFINGRVIADLKLALLKDISDKKKKVFICNNQLAAVFVPRSEIQSIKHLETGLFDLSLFTDFEKENINLQLVSYVWDLININSDEINKDFQLRLSSHSKLNFLTEVSGNVCLSNEDQIFIEENVTIKPGVVLDASEGPVYIEKNVVINANSVIHGPVFIGESSIIKSLTNISTGVTLGKVCKAGGEIEQSVFMPYTNKQHNGFLGNSYLGSWVNIGAGSNTSSLKNNYGKIKVNLSDKEINTDLRFLGLMMGDHSKSAINTMFNTGTVVGFSANIFGEGFPPKFIPSFFWGGSGNYQVYNVIKSIETAKAMTSRRMVEFTQDDENLFIKIFNLTGNKFDKEGP